MKEVNNYNVILFDLDGTLTDPGNGIINSIQYALNHFGITEDDRESLKKFIGPPLRESFMVYFNFDHDAAVAAVEKYREYFRVKGIYENVVYPLIPELLADLCVSGKKLILATSKPTEFAVQILDHFKLAQYIHYTAGSNMDGSRTKKGEVIAFALSQCQLTNRPDIVMVGDRKHDMIGAREIGIDSIGVLYGYGSQDELEQEQPTLIARDVQELRALLL
ncbi:HAD family hydrolase [Dehalobacter sp. DCM]|uniref:HAD family hydrolase n=1 Tax=Dehalobacter sp. DCM TaxID=2907827 RepID=UPI003081E892|nr:HAD family hydrolase [Dehalobacter sp. DCM]